MELLVSWIIAPLATILVIRFAPETLPIISVGGVAAYLLATNTADRKPVKIRNRKDRS
jgi:hypothetical protein